MDILEFLECGTIVDSGKGTCIIGWGKRTWLQKPLDSTTFYFPDFFLHAEKPWFVHEYNLEIKHQELQHLLKMHENAPVSTIPWQNSAKLVFHNAFENLQSCFKSEKLQKAVPYIFENASIKMTPHHIFHALISILEHAVKFPIFPYGFWGESEGILGATPELLFRISENKLHTVACAGTSLVEDADKMLDDVKLLHEHNLVIEGIRESLLPFGDFYPGSTHVQKYSKLCHLITPISVKLTNQSPINEIINVLHPTPALGAYPRPEGKLWLEEFNKLQPRGRFGAPAGYVQQGNATFYVAIRNIQWQNNHIKLGAGCGIVPQSHLESEWNEILLKIKSIKGIMSL